MNMGQFLYRGFWVVVVGWVLLRSVLLYHGYHGNPDPSARERVLRHFTQEDIDKGRSYARVGFWAKVLKPFLQVALLLGLLWAGWPTVWHERLTTWTGGGIWLPNLLFLLAFLAVLQVFSLPFDYYLGHLCETAAGFSTMTASAWFFRYLKMILIGWPIQIAGTMLVLWTFWTFTRWWPVLIPVVTTTFGILMTVIFPLVITPVFYEQKPLAEGPLKERILGIASQAKVPVEGIYEIDESRYSKHTNAYFTGLFSQKRIVLYDTLIKSHTVDEAALIFAHEVGHWRHDHVFIGISLGFLGSLAGCVLLWWVFPFLREIPFFNLGDLWSARNLPFFMVMSMVGQLWFAPVQAQISQHFERQADAASLELTGLRQVFIDAEARLARDNHSELLPHPLRVFWLYSHPPAIDRIAAGEAATGLASGSPSP